MSLSATRQELAQILDSVDGVQGYEFLSRTSLDPGDAFPIWDRDDDPFARSFVSYWWVIVILPVGDEDASAWIEEKYDSIGEALLDNGFGISLIEQAPFTAWTGNRDVLVFTISREA